MTEAKTYPMEVRCAWCPGQPIIRMERAEAPDRVSHGMCQQHYDELVRQLNYEARAL
ncbi:MAG: hypothetical protein ACREQA_20720 [Candidatus Binatia bacterium]